MESGGSPMEVRSLAKLANIEAAKRLRIPQAPLHFLKRKTRPKVLPRLPPNSFKAVPHRPVNKFSQSLSVSGLPLERKRSEGLYIHLHSKRTSFYFPAVKDLSVSCETPAAALGMEKEPLAMAFVQIHRGTPTLTAEKGFFREYDKSLRERLVVFVRPGLC